MADEPFRPRRPTPPPPPDEAFEGGAGALDKAQAFRRAAEADERDENWEPQPQDMGDMAGKVSGNRPQGFIDAMKKKKSGGQEPKKGFAQMSRKQELTPPHISNAEPNIISAASGHLKTLIEGARGMSVFEDIELPSKGRFYDGMVGPRNGIIGLRPMTGEEEQILATPRYVHKGSAINMIFSKCMKEHYKPEDFLTIDRTYLLIYLRGISYSPQYDVDIRCSDCEKRFATTIDLNTLFVESCPDDYGPNLSDVTPTTKYKFNYRLSTGQDEITLSDYRERRVRMYGDSAADDSLTYRTAQLLIDIEGLSDKTELQTLIKNLPISDVSYIRNCINDPPFGVDTKIGMHCPMCLHEFEVELPLEADFFFPRRKKDKTQA